MRFRRGGKYGAKRTKVDGYSFDSIAESRRYVALKLMQMAGAISQLEVHPVYLLQATFWVKGKIIRQITYKADFCYLEKLNEKKQVEVVEDVKGVRTEVFRIKEKLFRKLYPYLDLRIVEARNAARIRRSR